MLLRVAGNAIAKEAGKPARVLRPATCRISQADALALLPSVHCDGLTGHHAETEGSEDGRRNERQADCLGSAGP